MKRGGAGPPGGTLAAATALLLAAGCAGDRISPRPSPSPEPAVFVVNSLGETLSRILIAGGTVTRDAVTVGAIPNAIAIDSSGRRGFVASSGSNRLDLVDLDTPATLGAIDLGPGSNPWAVVPAPGGGTAYVSNWLTDDVARVDVAARRVASRFEVGRRPEGLLVAGDVLLVALSGYLGPGYGPGEVAVASAAGDSVRTRLAVGTNPQALAPAPDGTVHVVCTGNYGSGAGRVFVIDPTLPAVVDSIDVGGTPGTIVVLPDGLGAVAGVEGGLRFYDRASRSVTPSRALGNEGQLTALAYDAVAGRLYVADFDDSLVYELDPVADSLVATYSVGHGPVAIAVRR